MLQLTRNIGETVIIGDNIKVQILSIKGNQVRLGFDAPQSVRIDREELTIDYEITDQECEEKDARVV